MRRLADLAAGRMGDCLAALPDGTARAVERLDDGTPLAVEVTVRGRRAVLDFAGSGGVHSGNLNATPAIATSAALYVLRLLLDRPLPLNEGLLRAVELRLPPRSILDPGFDGPPEELPAVVGGNVETSQRLVDAMLRALELAACSQGTMNNVLFGSGSWAYYETVGGGCGATARRAGASGRHSHMTNTRIADPEILELRYPVRLVRFALRRGSGGAGARPGGDGLVREYEFLAPLELSILTQHRVVAPYGLAGGGPGACGEQWIVRADGRRVALAPVDGCDVGPGDRLVLLTPGGGAHGAVPAGAADQLHETHSHSAGPPSCWQPSSQSIAASTSVPPSPSGLVHSPPMTSPPESWVAEQLPSASSWVILYSFPFSHSIVSCGTVGSPRK